MKMKRPAGLAVDEDVNILVANGNNSRPVGVRPFTESRRLGMTFRVIKKFDH